jgi:twinkle protein
MDSEFLKHIPCDKCGSSDANSLYTDGHTYCFACETYGEKEVTEVFKKETITNFLEGSYTSLGKRKISEETCRFWDYQVGTIDNSKVHIANHKNEHGVTVAQKLRFPNKTFAVKGEMKSAGLYGQWLWRDGGKMVTVVEGELDALSLSQAFGNKWAVVSLRSGAAGAKRDIKSSLEWLEKFDSVIFMLDNDDVGKKAAMDCAGLLSPSKAKIAKLPLKDASDMLQAGKVKELVDAVWSAKSHRPDGILNGEDLWEAITTQNSVDSTPYPFEGLNTMTRGCRKGELVTITAGSGIGKSLMTREIAYHLLKAGRTIGYIALEESVKRTGLGLMSIEINKILHFEDHDADSQEMKQAFDATLGTGRVYLYDHFGSTDSDNLLSKIRYLVRGCECDYIILDHLSIVVSGLEDGDERRAIDNTMTKLRSLVEELGCGMLLVSHLKRPSGDKGHEEGVQTSLSQLRGSAAIAQLSDMVIGLERNQQSDNPNETTVRVLKNRWSGETGICTALTYNKDTGRMQEDGTGLF